MSATAAGGVSVYAAVGPVIHHWVADVAACTLRQTGNSVRMPQNVQYAWPDAARRHLYACSSNVARKVASGTPSHHRQAFRIDARTGDLSPHGEPMELPWRPVHMTLDDAGRHALVVYPDPPRGTVHRIGADGRFGADVPQPHDLACGEFPHQVRMLPNGAGVVIVCRGYNPEGSRGEVPGVLKVYDYRDGILTPRGAIAPREGYGFGPRHIDFHPSGRWLFASLERQNRLHVFGLEGGTISAEPLFVRDNLKDPAAAMHHQMVGTVRIHPSGRFAYVANRCSETVEWQGHKVSAGGENTLAVYAIDQDTGEPTLIQHCETQSIHVRTFAMDPSGRMLVAASIEAETLRVGDALQTLPARLTTYRVGDDGRLTLVQAYDVPTAGLERMFWMGVVGR